MSPRSVKIIQNHQERAVEFYLEEIDHGVAILAVDGGLDAQTEQQFLESIEKILQGGVRKLIIDCDKLKHISSGGVGTLIRLHKRMAERGGDVKLVAVHGMTFDVLQILSLDKVFDIYRARLAFRPPDIEPRPWPE
jgi:anti-anti-sigma factor